MTFSQGRAFKRFNEVVIGSEVANALNYALGVKVYLSHGTSGLPGSTHDDFAFEVVGILEATGTPTDRVLLIDLKGFELIHLGWKSGSKLISLKGKSVDQIPAELLESKSVTALYVGAKSRLQLLRLKRSLNDYNQEALSAVLPGAALSRMWRLMGTAENSIKVLGWLVLLISIVSMVSTSLASLESRTREMTILRSLGASPLSLGIMVMIESLIISLTAAVMAVLLLSYVSALASGYLSSEFGFTTTQQLISFEEIKLLMIIVLAGLLSSLWPAWRVYRQQLTKGLA
jgi:putative ABC transport system permease protein